MTPTARLAVIWTWLYTFPLARATRDRRRAEIRNDLAEQGADGGVDGHRIARGMGADLVWMAGRVGGLAAVTAVALDGALVGAMAAWFTHGDLPTVAALVWWRSPLLSVPFLTELAFAPVRRLLRRTGWAPALAGRLFAAPADALLILLYFAVQAAPFLASGLRPDVGWSIGGALLAALFAGRLVRRSRFA